MENWKERFEYIYVIEENKGEKYLRKYDHTTIVESLEHFISEELDKAREEGRREGSEITSRYISDFVISESGKSGRKEILEYIDKLSKYQFTRSKHLKREGVKRRNICQGILDRSRRWKKV